MKFIQLSDLHLVPKGKSLYGSDPACKLQRAIESINKHQSDADFVVITGDLSDKGELSTYYDLKEMLNSITIPYYLIIGNHDNREAFLKVFGNKFECDTFVHFSQTKDNSLFLFLDTKIGDWHNGGFCKYRLGWLDKKLKVHKNLSVYLFMHHPPFTIYNKQMDSIGFEPKDKFWQIIEQYKNVKHIFFGHVHLPICGIYNGTGYSSTRGTNHQIALLPKDDNTFFNSNEQSTYSIVRITHHQVNCIIHEYLNEENAYSCSVPLKEEYES